MNLLSESSVALVLFALMIGTCIAPVTAQSSNRPTVEFAIHVNFYYQSPLLGSLSNIEITVHDQTGSVVGRTISPDGSEAMISFQTDTPVYIVTANAFGYATRQLYSSGPQYYIWPVSGVNSRMVLTVGGDYWISVKMAP
jgi:C4-dicarboxylate transporter